MTVRRLAALLALGAVGLAAEGCGPDEDPAEPPGRTVTAASVSFEVPGDWRVFDGDAARAGAAADLGVAASDVGADVRAVAVGPDGADEGSVERLLVVAGSGGVADRLRRLQEMVLLPGDGETARHDTAIGEADVASYPFELGALDLAAASVLLDEGDEAVSVVVSTHDAERTADLVEQVLDSLRASA